MFPNFTRQIVWIQRRQDAPAQQSYLRSQQRLTEPFFSAQMGRNLSLVLMILVMLIALLGTQLSIPAHASAPIVSLQQSP